MKSNVFSEIAVGDPSKIDDWLAIVDIDLANELGENMLHVAIAAKLPGICEALIRKGINVNHKNYLGRTPLHYAATHRLLAIAQLILDADGDVSAIDRDGNDALWTAAFNSDLPFVALLISHGANPQRKNNHGKSTLELARDRRNQALLAILSPEEEDR